MDVELRCLTVDAWPSERHSKWGALLKLGKGAEQIY